MTKIDIGIRLPPKSSRIWDSLYLTPVYGDLLFQFAEEGFTIERFKKEKDRLMALLIKLSEVGIQEIQMPRKNGSV